jgi:hypothetical protein
MMLDERYEDRRYFNRIDGTSQLLDCSSSTTIYSSNFYMLLRIS